MGVEIERKFTINKEFVNSLIDKATKSAIIRQGYLSSSPDRSVRIRISDKNAFITIKGKTVGISRSEFEYPIPLEDALDLLSLSENPIIEKIRYIIEENNNMWEIDLFKGANKGLIIAEIELKSETQEFIIPTWIDKEVTGNSKYYNLALSRHPYNQWIEIDN